MASGSRLPIEGYRANEGAIGEKLWAPIDGNDQVILGDLTILSDGGPIQIAPEKAKTNASGTSSNEPGPNRPADQP